MKIRQLICQVLTCLTVISLQSQTIKLTPYASNLGYAIDIRNCNDDRLFVADRNGLIRIVKANASTLSTPFLDITSKISSTQSEEGFLGFCFSPFYQTNGKFYVCYTTIINNDLFTIVEEYKVSSNPDIADPNSARTIITAKQPFQNHKGGCIFFGRDGLLYIPLGDGGSGGDPFNNAQNNSVILGKILRIDINNVTSTTNYIIPPGNPFYNASGNTRREIWAKGVRNPWRVSKDRVTGDIWIGDVGEGEKEEINLQLSNSKGGENYGWRIQEGEDCFNSSPNCNTPGLVEPIYDYGHHEGKAIIGGYAYRGVQSKALWGIYIFADFTGKWIDGLKMKNGKPDGDAQHLLGNTHGRPISFGEDRYGELYVCLNDEGTIYKIVEDNSNPTPKAFFTVTHTNTSYVFKALEGTGFAYQWYLNDAPIAGASTTSLQPTQSGVYKLRVMNSSGTIDFSDAFTVDVALPVGFSSFFAKNIRAGLIELSWTTETEQNNQGFELERKLQNENDFQYINFIPTKSIDGNSTSTLRYTYDDTIKFKGIVQYRLKQQDYDGNFKYSPIVTINVDSDVPDIRIAPNPAQGWIQIFSTITDTYQYIIHDVNGKTVLKDSFKGYEHRISTLTLGSGVYYIKIQSLNTGKTVTKTLFIEKN